MLDTSGFPRLFSISHMRKVFFLFQMIDYLFAEPKNSKRYRALMRNNIIILIWFAEFEKQALLNRGKTPIKDKNTFTLGGGA